MAQRFSRPIGVCLPESVSLWQHLLTSPFESALRPSRPSTSTFADRGRHARTVATVNEAIHGLVSTPKPEGQALIAEKTEGAQGFCIAALDPVPHAQCQAPAQGQTRSSSSVFSCFCFFSHFDPRIQSVP